MSQKKDLQKAYSSFFEEIATRGNISTAKLRALLPNPDKVLRSKGNKYEILEDLEMDSHVESCIQSRLSGVLSMLTAINHGRPMSEEAKLVERAFKELDTQQITTDILKTWRLGFQPLELVWHRTSDGYLLPQRIHGKPQDWFAFDDDNNCRLKARTSKEGLLLPDRRFIIPTHKADYMNPYGKAILSRCFWPVTFKKAILRFWVEFCEVFGFPWVLATVRPADGTDTKEDFRDKLLEQRKDGIFILEQGQTIDMKEATRVSSVDIFIRLILFCNAEISKAILSQTLTTEQGDTGSYAMAQTHLMVRKDVVDADKRLVESVFNQIIAWIIELNIWQPKDIPTFTLYQEADVDQALAERDAKLTSDGRLRFRKIYYIRNYGLKEDEFDVVDPEPQSGMLSETPHTPPPDPTPAPQGAPGGLPDKPAIPGTHRADVFATAPDQAVIDDATNSDPEQLDSVMLEMMKPLLEMVMSGAEYDNILATVQDLFPQMDSNKIMKHLADQILLADMVGQASAQLEVR